MESKTYTSQDVERACQALHSELTSGPPAGVAAAPGGAMGQIDPTIRNALVAFLNQVGPLGLKLLIDLILSKLPG